MMRSFIFLILLIAGFFERGEAVINATDVYPLRDDDGIIMVTEDNYDQLKQGISEHFTALFITSSAPTKNGQLCDVCNDFEPVMRHVAVLISQQAPNSQIVFLKADVSHNKLLVKDLGLTTIPHLLIFPPPTTDDFEWKQSHFYQYELKKELVKDALPFADFIAKILKVYINVDQSFKYQQFVKYFIGCMAVFTILKKAVLPKIPNKPKFASIIISMSILLFSITGYKFTQIHSVPFIARDSKGKIMYFSGGTGWQFGIEIISVSAMYIAMGILFCAMILIPKLVQNPRVKWASSAICSYMLFFLFSYYVTCFNVKSPGYPYMF